MTEPVTLAQAKAQCRVLHDDDDNLIASLIIAAREWVENFTGHILVQREVTQYFACFTRPLLFAWPIADDATVAIAYLDSAGASQAVTGARIIRGNGWASIAPAVGESWPSIYYGPASVTLEAGYAAAADVPESMKQAMLLLIAHWFANREAVGNITTELPFAVEALCRPYRMIVV